MKNCRYSGSCFPGSHTTRIHTHAHYRHTVSPLFPRLLGSIHRSTAAALRTLPWSPRTHVLRVMPGRLKQQCRRLGTAPTRHCHLRQEPQQSGELWPALLWLSQAHTWPCPRGSRRWRTPEGPSPKPRAARRLAVGLCQAPAVPSGRPAAELASTGPGCIASSTRQPRHSSETPTRDSPAQTTCKVPTQPSSRTSGGMWGTNPWFLSCRHFLGQ